MTVVKIPEVCQKSATTTFLISVHCQAYFTCKLHDKHYSFEDFRFLLEVKAVLIILTV